jgi:hypothetical protein
MEPGARIVVADVFILDVLIARPTEQAVSFHQAHGGFFFRFLFHIRTFHCCVFIVFISRGAALRLRKVAGDAFDGAVRRVSFRSISRKGFPIWVQHVRNRCHQEMDG